MHASISYHFNPLCSITIATRRRKVASKAAFPRLQLQRRRRRRWPLHLLRPNTTRWLAWFRWRPTPPPPPPPSERELDITTEDTPSSGEDTFFFLFFFSFNFHFFCKLPLRCFYPDFVAHFLWFLNVFLHFFSRIRAFWFSFPNPSPVVFIQQV